jgi:hypothetical protein
LEKPSHFRLENEVIYGIHVHVKRGARGGNERSPVPVVVFRVQKKVRADDGDAQSHNHQNHKDQQKEAVDVVDFIVPDARENKVRLDEDGSERK